MSENEMLVDILEVTGLNSVFCLIKISATAASHKLSRLCFTCPWHDL